MITSVCRSAMRLRRAWRFMNDEIGELRTDAVQLRAAKDQRLSEIFDGIMHELGFEIELVGTAPPSGVVLVSNHLSYLDPMLLCAAMPAVPISKSEVARWPRIGDGARALDVIFVNRESSGSRVAALRRAMRALESGSSVLNFPEGTTTKGDRVLFFQRGIFGVAKILQRPVIPIGLTFEDDELTWTGGQTFVPHLLRTSARRSSRARVAIGRPLYPGDFRDADALAAAARERVGTLVGAPTATRARYPVPVIVSA